MTGFIVETFVPRLHSAGLAELIARAEGAAVRLRASGTDVTHVRSYLVPEDEMCMHVYEAETADEVREAVELAGIEIDRIVETIEDETRETSQ